MKYSLDWYSKLITGCGLLLFLAVTGIGCSSLETSPTSTITKITIESDTVLSVTVEAMASPMPMIVIPPTTAIIIHTPMPTITNTPLPPTSSPTVTPVPTLTNTGEGELVQELMATNGGCKLPCWWGIEPGKGTLEDVDDMFTNLGVPWLGAGRYNGAKTGDLILSYSDSDGSYLDMRTSLYLYADHDETIQHITISSIRFRNGLDMQAQVFERDWQQFFLSEVLQKYGKPSSVHLMPISVVERTTNYNLSLNYTELGINVTYGFRGVELNEEYDEICFTMEDVDYIRLSLYDLESLTNEWQDRLLPPAEGSEGADFLNNFLWEIQMGTSLDEFYETYKNPDNLDCIQISR